VLSALVGDATAGDEPVTDVVDELLADLACYPSVTGNTSLTEESVVDLLDRLDDCENPYACPHGRPVVIRLNRGRSAPGSSVTTPVTRVDAQSSDPLDERPRRGTL